MDHIGMLLTGSWGRKWFHLLRYNHSKAIGISNGSIGSPNTSIVIVWLVEILLMCLMVAHSTDMPSTVLQNIHRSALSNLTSALSSLRSVVRVAVSTVWHCLIIDS